MNVTLLDDCKDRFAPLSYTTPAPFLIVGGLRLVEHWMIRLRRGINLNLSMPDEEAVVHLNRNELLVKRYWGYEPQLTHIEVPSVSSCVVPSTSSVMKIVEYLERGVEVSCNGSILVYGTDKDRTVEDCSIPVLKGAWDLVKFNTDLLRETIHLLGKGEVVTIDSKISEDIYLDTANGPVVLLGSNLVAPISVKGPAFIGPKCEIQPFTLLRPGSVLYSRNVVGGEVKNSIMDIESRKPHHGYLGDSYLGKWINMGAGTSVSNLKNTLGSVRFMGNDTGMTKLGPIIGDWVRSGINSSIMTGKAVGPGSHIYGLINMDVPPFVFYKNYGESIMSQVDEGKLIDIISKVTDGNEQEMELASIAYKTTQRLRNGISKFNFRL